MPTYEYECEGCGDRFSTFQRMADDPLEECPACQGPVHRIISGGLGPLLKGRGSKPECASCSRTGGCQGCSGCH
jgi:putative FmdB family regulatory protein